MCECHDDCMDNDLRLIHDLGLPRIDLRPGKDTRNQDGSKERRAHLVKLATAYGRA